MSTDKNIQIGSKAISLACPAFIIAEVSANHKGSFDETVDIIRAAAKSGADAVKLQTYTADTMTLNCDNDCFKIQHGTIWDGRTLYDLYKEGSMDWGWQSELKRIAEDLDLILFSTPFDKTAVDFLDGLDAPAYKIASFEITDISLIEYVANKGKPIIISTGIATLDEIQDAVDACGRAGNEDVVLLKCTSQYPAKIENMNLATMVDMTERFDVCVGLSDHSLDTMLPAVAVAMGGRVVEKHFTLDRANGGLDAEFSLEPAEFKQMVENIRKVEAAVGRVDYELIDSAKVSRKFSRSLFVAADIRAGEIFTEENIRSVRPSDGLAPKFMSKILGKKAKNNIPFGTALNWNMIEGTQE